MQGSELIKWLFPVYHKWRLVSFPHYIWTRLPITE
jgi:hypothetical protein